MTNTERIRRDLECLEWCDRMVEKAQVKTFFVALLLGVWLGWLL